MAQTSANFNQNRPGIGQHWPENQHICSEIDQIWPRSSHHPLRRKDSYSGPLAEQRGVASGFEFDGKRVWPAAKQLSIARLLRQSRAMLAKLGQAWPMWCSPNSASRSTLKPCASPEHSSDPRSLHSVYRAPCAATPETASSNVIGAGLAVGWPLRRRRLGRAERYQGCQPLGASHGCAALPLIG